MNERVDIVLHVNEENSPMKERMEERNVDIGFEKARGEGSHGAPPASGRNRTSGQLAFEMTTTALIVLHPPSMSKMAF